MQSWTRRLVVALLPLALTGVWGGIFLSQPTPAKAQAVCTPLRAVGGSGTRVRKRVSPAGTLVTSNNWNTDFAVPGGNAFRRYTVTVAPENDGQYSIHAYLKYGNDTADQFYNQDNVPLSRGRRLILSGQPRSGNQQPFQVNVSVGGTVALGNTYTVSVVGCR